MCIKRHIFVILCIENIDFVWHFLVFKFKTSYYYCFPISLQYHVSQLYQLSTSKLFSSFDFNTTYHNCFAISLQYHVSQLFHHFTSRPRIATVSPFHFNITYHNCFHHSISKLFHHLTSIPRITIVSPFDFNTTYHNCFTIWLQYHVSQLFSPFEFNTTSHNCFNFNNTYLKRFHRFTSIPRIAIVSHFYFN